MSQSMRSATVKSSEVLRSNVLMNAVELALVQFSSTGSRYSVHESLDRMGIPSTSTRENEDNFGLKSGEYNRLEGVLLMREGEKTRYLTAFHGRCHDAPSTCCKLPSLGLNSDGSRKDFCVLPLAAAILKPVQGSVYEEMQENLNHVAIEEEESRIMRADSVRRKRKKKMNKHKLRKRRKANRHRK